MDADIKTVQALVGALEKIAAEHVVYPETNMPGYAGMAVVTARETAPIGRALIAQMQRDAVQPGWKLVPVEPTIRMVAAAGPAVRACFGFDGKQGNVSDLWAAMLAAAPHPEAKAGKSLKQLAAERGINMPDRYVPEAQALDSQLQQPDGHSTPCVEAASTTPLPCPFCGSEPRISGRAGSSSEDAAFVAFAACYGDSYVTHAHHHATGETLQEAEAAVLAIWNRRSAPGAQQQDDHAGSPAPSCYGVILAGKVMPVGSKEQAEKLADHAASEIVPLYTHPAPSAESSKAALSDEEIKAAAMEAFDATWDADDETLVNKYGHGVYFSRFVDFARAILARAGIGESRREPQA